MFGFRRKRQAVNRILLHRKHLLHNLGFWQSFHPERTIFPVVKSNAYGHGLTEIVKMLRSYRTPYLAIDSMIEYKHAHRLTDKKFLLMGETLPANYARLNTKRVTPCIGSMEVLRVLCQRGKAVSIHLRLNTGMRREGRSADELPQVLAMLREHPFITVEGVMSHLYSADEIGATASIDAQVQSFTEMYTAIIHEGHTPTWRHIANTAGTHTVSVPFCNAYRVGLGIYGLHDLDPQHQAYEQMQGLKPVLEARTRIVKKTVLPAGQGLSYGHTRKNETDTVIGRVPRGYQEGLPRLASNHAIGRRRNEAVYQRGTVCMNLSAREIPDQAQVGDEIVLLAPSLDSGVTVRSWTDYAQTIPYEIVTGLDPLIRREFI